MKPIKITRKMQQHIDAKASLLLRDSAKFIELRDTYKFLRNVTDAALTIAFARDLEFIEAELQREEFRPLKSQKYIPYVSLGGEWAETITHRQIRDFGKAQWITERANDVPMVGLSAEESSRTIGTFALGWQYTYWDLARASYLSVKLDQEKPRSCRDGIMRFHDTVAALGDATIGAKGLANSTAVTDLTAAFAATDGDKFDSDTPQKIIKAFGVLIDSVKINTYENHECNTVLMPIAYLSMLNTRAYGTDENPTTILQVLRSNHPGVTFDSWEALKGVGTGGLDCIMAYEKNPAVVRYHAPVIYKTMPPESKGWTVETVAFGRSGLTEIRLPKAVSRADLAAMS